MAPHDTQLIIELTNEIRGYREDTKVLTTKLFGDPNNETEHGRLPMIEAAQAEQSERIAKVEDRVNRARFRLQGIGWVVTSVLLLAELLYHLKGAISR